MGVKGLWPILSPLGNKVSIVELQGKKIAVDLSGWVCESQTVGDKGRWQQPKLHLRTIFFRTSILLMANVSPVFVLDGDPPDIKQSTLHRRNQIKYPHRKGNESEKETEKEKKGNRKMLKSYLREGQEMLLLLGLSSVWSGSEGEAFCALLDRRAIVDGIITQDNDAFLYGARKVYRNFTTHCGSATVDVIEMFNLENQLNLSREKLIAMSLLCGCDYDGTGVNGIGPDISIKYLSNFDGDIIDRLRNLKNDKQLRLFEREKNSCKKCHHPGKQQEHSKGGCPFCGTDTTCFRTSSEFVYDTLSDKEKLKVDLELKIRSKIVDIPTFPDEATIAEYLQFEQEIPDVSFRWEEPNVAGFLSFMEKKCNWCTCYAFEKVIPLYCRWSLMNKRYNLYKPRKILKKKIFKAVSCFDLEWHGDVNFTCRLHKDAKFGEVFTTIEPQALVMISCRDIFDAYVAETKEKMLAKKMEKRKTASKASKKVGNVGDLVDDIGRLSLKADDVGKPPKKKRITTSRSGKENQNGGGNSKVLETIDLVSSSDEENDLNKTLIYCSDGDCDYKIDESDIINNIISRREYY